MRGTENRERGASRRENIDVRGTGNVERLGEENIDVRTENRERLGEENTDVRERNRDQFLLTRSWLRNSDSYGCWGSTRESNPGPGTSQSGAQPTEPQQLGTAARALA